MELYLLFTNIIKRVKRESTDYEKTFANIYPAKDLYPKHIKNSFKLILKRQKVKT